MEYDNEDGGDSFPEDEEVPMETEILEGGGSSESEELQGHLSLLLSIAIICLLT